MPDTGLFLIVIFVVVAMGVRSYITRRTKIDYTPKKDDDTGPNAVEDTASTETPARRRASYGAARARTNLKTAPDGRTKPKD